jgi:hypothetical protein
MHSCGLAYVHVSRRMQQTGMPLRIERSCVLLLTQANKKQSRASLALSLLHARMLHTVLNIYEMCPHLTKSAMCAQAFGVYTYLQRELVQASLLHRTALQNNRHQLIDFYLEVQLARVSALCVTERLCPLLTLLKNGSEIPATCDTQSVLRPQVICTVSKPPKKRRTRYSIHPS